MTVLPASIPSPSRGVWHLGPLPVRAYALCIVVGIAVAVVLGQRRWAARGGDPGLVGDVAAWAVPFGIVGGRLYHVVTSPEAYFGAHGDPLAALAIWRGGLGIWGAIALGGVGALVGVRRRGVPLPPFADAVAPGVALAQAVGRLGNWFNQELYGRPTALPWALRIDPAHRPAATPDRPAYHPTFLYELLWDAGTAGIVVWADRRFRLGHGRAFALYVLVYVTGRAWIEALRVDDAHRLFGLRLNDWTCLVVGAGALTYLLLTRGRHREEPGTLRPAVASSTGSAQAAPERGPEHRAGQPVAGGPGAAAVPLEHGDAGAGRRSGGDPPRPP